MMKKKKNKTLLRTESNFLNLLKGIYQKKNIIKTEQLPTVTTFIQHCTEEPSNAVR